MLEEFDEYLDLQCGRSAHTRRAYLGDLRSLFAFLAERGSGLDALSLPLLRAWLAASAGAGAARTTLSRRTSGVKAFTAWAARRGLLASRTNALFSIPMVWFMVATSHFFGNSTHFKLTHIRDGMTVVGPGRSLLLTYWGIVIVIVALLEVNALGLLGGAGPGPTKVPLEKHRNTIISGFVLWAIFYALWEILFRA